MKNLAMAPFALFPMAEAAWGAPDGAPRHPNRGMRGQNPGEPFCRRARLILARTVRAVPQDNQPGRGNQPCLP